MVLLSRITTKTGDRGMTALGDGRRLRKDHPRIEATGEVDELNAVLGLAIAAHPKSATADLLRAVQNDLFDLGADVTMPPPKAGGPRRARTALRLTAAHVVPLEQAIERVNAGLVPLKSFVLPGGTPLAAWLHLARTVCRRAERRLVTLSRREGLNPQTIVYLNRLSDLLFVLARRANGDGHGDVLWVPGRRLEEASS
ncbi:MAG TPA: cob(I)yrinic acid a,c-diamide adenosyltransferase [Candidatus Polarisedimenticolia bacterium]|nr:cob(I)yrinic acid a,c-diamide adenosyltransferase [Candidatus Polarisedimenticolia bacterium]